jgi:thioredoxin-related protein
MINLSRKIEFIANVAIIVVAMLLVVVLSKQYLMVGTIKSVTGAVTDQQSHIGTKLHVSGIDWNKNRQTLLLAISSTCRYCTESAPFYQRLLKENTDTKILAVMPEEVTHSRNYLENQQVHIDDIKELPLDSLGVSGTPTLILVDGNGIVTGWWVGRLSQIQETEVLVRLQKST